MADKANEVSIGAARVAVAAHTASLMIEGDADIQVWHLLVSLHEYCAAEGINFDEAIAEVREFLSSEGAGHFPAWEAFTAAKNSARQAALPTDLAVSHETLEQELLEAKGRLYGLLLQKGSNNRTGTEINLAFELSRDDQVQSFLQSNLRPNDRLNGALQ